MSDLPPGPLTINQFDSVHDSTGRFVASLAGNRALAELLIRAEREADPTPLDAEWLVSVGGEGSVEYKGIVDVLFDHPEFEVVVEFRPRYSKTPHAVLKEIYETLSKIRIPVPTRGTFRTTMRLLGITIEEPK